MCAILLPCTFEILSSLHLCEKAYNRLMSDKENEKELREIMREGTNYQSKFEDGLLWNDKFLKIQWPNKKPKLSKKDRKLKSFKEFKKTYIGF